MDAISLAAKAARIDKPWSPKILAALNDMHIKLARLEGEFVWHKHDETDELFLVVEGAFDMHYRDRVVPVRAGELVVVPKGVEHKPVADKGDCLVMLVEPAGTVNTGDAGGDLTAEVEWV